MIISRIAVCAGVIALLTVALPAAGAADTPRAMRSQEAAVRFDLGGDDHVLFRAAWLQERRSIPQSFAFDDVNGHLYVLQVEGSNDAGRHSEHAVRGDLTLSKLSGDGARILGHMRLRGFGHGVSLGVEPRGAEVFVWTEVDSEPIAAGIGRGRRIGVFRFVDGATLESTSPEIRKLELAAGARSCTPSLDLAHGRMAMKYGGPDGRGHVTLFDFAAVAAGTPRPLADIILPADLGVLQGWCTYGDYVYILTGEPYRDRNPPPGNAELWCLEWRTGAVVQRQPVRALADLVYREPEGLAVQRTVAGSRLCLGFGASVSEQDPRRQLAIAYKDATVAPSAATSAPAAALERDFLSPPAAAKPVVFWWWFNSHVNKEGITRDLEEFRAKGLGGVVLINTTTGFGTRPIPKGPAFLSPEWRALYRHALQEANRLGLEVGVNLSTGWCMGGPWIKPENSGRWYLQSQLVVEGPATFSGVLPLPGNRDGYDNAGQLQVKNFVNLPLDQADYRDTSIVAFPEPVENGAGLGDDRRRLLAAKSNRLDASSHARPEEIMDPTLAAWNVQPGDQPVEAERVVDLTTRVDAGGRLTWEVPPGRWVILRTGHRMTGARTLYALPEAEGLEIDWLNAAGVEAQFEHLGRVLLEEAGPLAGTTLRYFHEDSFEDGFPNWTTNFLERFKDYRGYDATPYLPVFVGRIVGNAEISDRFLYDYRRTVADLMADAHYRRFAELCHERGLEVQNEGAGPSWSGSMGMDALKNLGRSDRPMGEFWQDNYRFVVDGQNQVTKMVATAAHIYGKRTASAEAFTTFSHWSDDPAALKPTADRAFCEGINRIVFHESTATRPQDGKPGYEYGAGTHFNPNITWWEQAGAFVGYLARCQALLQSGLFVADVLYYAGDHAPNLVPHRHVPADLGPGYDYDVCNTEVLLERLSVRDGRLVLPDGMSYRLLVLPDTRKMPVAVARKVRALVEAGATVVGPKPDQDPGLANFPAADAEVKAIAAVEWSGAEGATPNRLGRGRVFSGLTAREVLAADGVAADFAYDEQAGSLDHIHRRVDGAEVYFVVNRNRRQDRVTCTFRAPGLQPELWNPVTGAVREVPGFTSDGNVTTLTIDFAPQQSWFVVFRKPAAGPEAASDHDSHRPPELVRRPVMTLTGSWQVTFDPKLGGPIQPVMFPSLTEWTLSRDERIRFYSGTAVYRKSFEWTGGASAGRRVLLELGGVKNVAEVTLNGTPLGVVWCAPWEVDVTAALEAGPNQLEVRIVNLWPNRLIGDKYLPASKRIARTNVPLTDDAELLPSGLLGPVAIVEEESP